MKPTCMLMLGRNGDLLNVFPIARHFALQTGSPVPFVVSAQYLTLVRGVTYIEPDPVHFAFFRVDHALAYARSKYENVMCPQVWGMYAMKYGRRREDGVSYNVAAWIACGLTIEDFRNTEAFPLVIDRRDNEREQLVCRRALRGANRPILLYNLACGKSSPFASHQTVKAAIEKTWGHICTCINLCNIKAARIYDLLGLLDRAAILITTDSAILHLAAASKVPVIALVNNNPWQATEPRCNLVLKLRYADALEGVKEIHRVTAATLQLRRAETSNRDIEQPPVVEAVPSELESFNSK